MIYQLHPQRPKDSLEVHRLTTMPVAGALCQMHWHMLCENPRLMHTFYRVGPGGLCKLSQGRALLCGKAEDAEEFGAFLRFANILQLTSSHLPPNGWHVVEQSRVMLRLPCSPSDALLKNTAAPLPGFCQSVSPSDVIALLESSDGPIPDAARDFFYADLCARRNHGYAVLYGVKQQNVLQSTAGIWALLKHEGYIANVETHTQHRHKGLATALLSHLCLQYGRTRTLSLLCQDELIPFYARLGFSPTSRHSFVSVHSAT